MVALLDSSLGPCWWLWRIKFYGPTLSMGSCIPVTPRGKYEGLSVRERRGREQTSFTIRQLWLIFCFWIEINQSGNASYLPLLGGCN